MRRGSGEGTKARLVRSAVELFMAKGFGATTIQEIVERAEVTQGAFYHHFGRKEDILYHVYEVFVTQHLAAAEAVTGADLSASEAIVRLMEETAGTVAEFRQYASIVVGELRLLNGDAISERYGELNAKAARIIELWQQTIERGIASGEFNALLPDTRALAFAVFGMPVFTYAWMDTTSPMVCDDIGRGFGQLALRGLLNDQPAKSAGGNGRGRKPKASLPE